MAKARLDIGVSADAKQASATFKELSADIKAVGKESVGVTEGVAKVDAALAKLAKAPDTPMALARATAKVKLEVDELRAALEKTPASADKMKAISAALAQADSAMQKSIARAGKLGEAQEEVKQKMGLTAKGAESLGNSFGSLDGIMGKMADSSSGVSQGLAKIGFSVMAASAAFEFGYSTGTKFRSALTAMGVTLPDLSDKMGAVVVALESTVRGYKEAELVETAAVARARQIIALREQQAKAEQGLANAMAKSGLVWKDANAEREAVIAKLNAAEFALARVAKSEAAWTEAVKVNTPELQKLRKEAEEHGIALDKLAPRTAAAAAESDKYATSAKGAAAATRDATTAVSEAVAQAAAFEKWIQREAAAYDNLAESVARSRAAESAKQNFSSPEVEAGLQRIQFQAVGAAAAAGEFGTSLDTVAKKVVSLNGQLTVQQQIWLSVAMASDEATAALYRQIEATRALSDQQKESLDAVRGWSDYIIALKEGYDSGVTSLGSYIQQLVAFKSQLSQMFAAAEGDAKKSLEEMIQLIETLMQTAGARETGASGPVGWLNKAVRDAKGNK